MIKTKKALTFIFWISEVQLRLNELQIENSVLPLFLNLSKAFSSSKINFYMFLNLIFDSFFSSFSRVIAQTISNCVCSSSVTLTNMQMLKFHLGGHKILLYLFGRQVPTAFLFCMRPFHHKIGFFLTSQGQTACQLWPALVQRLEAFKKIKQTNKQKNPKNLLGGKCMACFRDKPTGHHLPPHHHGESQVPDAAWPPQNASENTACTTQMN